MRKVIAERTTASKNAPHFYLNVDLDAKKLSAKEKNE